jgi:hypothetical protein
MAVEHSNTMAADHAIECGRDGIVIGHLVKVHPGLMGGKRVLVERSVAFSGTPRIA